MTGHRRTIRPGPLPRDGTEISTHNRSVFESSSGREMDARKMPGRMQGSSPSCWVEEKSDGRCVSIRDGTTNPYWHNRCAGPHRYLAHRRLNEIDTGSIYSCRDGIFCRFIQKRKGGSVPIRNGTKNLFSYNLREGPHRYHAHRLLKYVDEGISPPVRDGTRHDGVEKIDGRSVPKWNGPEDVLLKILRSGPHRYLAHRWLQEIDIGSSPPCRDGTMRNDVEKRKGVVCPSRMPELCFSQIFFLRDGKEFIVKGKY